jgi:hypothetical protein
MNNGEGGSGLGESSGAAAPGSNGIGQGSVNGKEERMELRVTEDGMLEQVAMAVD